MSRILKWEVEINQEYMSRDLGMVGPKFDHQAITMWPRPERILSEPED